MNKYCPICAEVEQASPVKASFEDFVTKIKRMQKQLRVKGISSKIQSPSS